MVDLCGKDWATGERPEHPDDLNDVMSVEGDGMSVATEEIGDDTPKRKAASSTSNISSNPKLKAEDVICWCSCRNGCFY